MRPNTLRLFLLAIIMTCLAYLTNAQGVIHVPGDYSTIKSAVNAAQNGDTVLIAIGVYDSSGNRNITVEKSIVIAGEYIYSKNLPDVARTVIDCGGSNTAFEISGGSDVCVKFIGLTVTGFVEEEFDYSAIYIFGASAIFEACIFTENSSASYPAWGYRGTAISIEDSADVKIYNCLIANNGGAGIGISDTKYHHSLWYQHPRVFISGCTFADNTDSGIAINDQSGETVPELHISNSMFINNGNYGISEEYDGQRGEPLYHISNSIFHGNASGPVLGRYFDLDLLNFMDTNALGYDIDSFGNFDAMPVFKHDSLADYPYQYRYDSPNVNTGSLITFDVDNSTTDIGYGNIKKFYDLDCDYESLIASVQQISSTPSSTLELYPNPAVDRIYLKRVTTQGESATVQVHSIDGQLIMEVPYSNEAIDIHRIRPGIYLVSVVNPDGLQTQRLVIEQ